MTTNRAWHRLPACPWVKLDPSGDPYCIYRSLGTGASAVELARFTFLDQRYVDDASSRLREGFTGPLERVCTPKNCSRLLPKVVDAIRG